MNKIGRMAAMQILILVVATFSFAYIIGESIPSVAAQAEELGCCIDNEEGLCTPRTTRQSCVESGGEWNNEELCAINECQKGCCLLGDEAQFVNDARCSRLADLFGLPKDFKQQIKNELECLVLGTSAEKGACVFSGERCELKGENECLSEGGDYHRNLLCSSEELNTGCERQSSIGCVEGKDEIFWFDSCGNQENIYDSDKDKSWNNGRLLSKAESCNPDSSNANSQDCGNCNFNLGSFCSESGVLGGVKDGNFICKDVSCVDESGERRENGESWCVYDGAIGEGKDPVGSRHWKRVCINGEVKVEPCADYRGQICVESDVEIPETNEEFSVASCVVNEASNCLNYNSDKGTLIENCENNNQCYVKRINVDDGFKFDVCLPKYPRGRDLTGEGSDYCSFASQTCTVVDQKVFDSDGDFIGWENVINGECQEVGFTQQMNDFCISLGDCGAQVNIVGKGTNSYSVDEAPRISWNSYVKNSVPVEGQRAGPQSLDQLGIPRAALVPGEPEAEGTLAESLGGIGTYAGGLGTIIQAGYFADWFFLEGFGSAFQAPVLDNVVISAGLSVESMASTTLGAIGTALSAFSIGLSVGGIAAELFGLEGQASGITSAAGAVGGLVGSGTIGKIAGKIQGLFGGTSGGTGAAAGAAGGAGGLFSAAAAAAMWAAVFAVVAAVVLKVLGIGDTREIDVTFSCLPWEAPNGGEFCSECNGDPLKPCTQYRCESLGQACKLLNEDTENPSCESVVDDKKPPIISIGVIEEGFEFNNESGLGVSVRREGGNCIPEFRPVLFTLETDEPAQCKFDFNEKDFEGMSEYPIEGNAYTTNHTFSFFMPSLSSLDVYDLTGDIRKMFGDMDMHVKCQDYYGDITPREYSVNFCVESGPDLTPPLIVGTIPGNNGFIKFGETKSNLTVFLNEPSECRYDRVAEKAYDDMGEVMDCETELVQLESLGWTCKDEVLGLDESENSIYIKCKDQPWFKNTINESNRNVNSEDFVFTLQKSESELKIDSILPSGNVESGFQPASVDFEVRTSGGAQDGISTCTYSFDGNQTSTFFETSSRVHKQSFNQLFGGEYNLHVECVDVAGNVAREINEFEIDLDENPPQIVRAFKEGAQLIVLTDEESECYYDLNSCIYDVDNATSMTTVFSEDHRTLWEPGLTYHIKCIDIWGNAPNECSIKLLPNFF